MSSTLHRYKMLVQPALERTPPKYAPSPTDMEAMFVIRAGHYAVESPDATALDRKYFKIMMSGVCFCCGKPWEPGSPMCKAIERYKAEATHSVVPS